VRKQPKKSDKPKREKALTLRRAAFVAEFIRTFNARRSAIAAGYSERGAQAQGSYLLTNPNVIEEIEAARAKLIDSDPEFLRAVQQALDRSQNGGSNTNGSGQRMR